MKPYVLAILVVALVVAGIEGVIWLQTQQVHYDTVRLAPDADARAENPAPNRASLRDSTIAVYLTVPDRVHRQRDGQPLVSVPIRVTVGNGTYMPARIKGSYRRPLATVRVHPVLSPGADAPEGPAVWTARSSGLDRIDPGGRVDRVHDCPAASLRRPGWFKVTASIPWWPGSRPLVAFFELRD